MAAFLGVQYKGILGSGFALGQKGIRMPSGGALLLDQYSGAAAAYSVRKLSSSYSGSALRVRRSSDNAEQDIGFDGNDLDTSALTTFVGANDGFVTTWYDQGGNGNDATNATAANQPQIVSSGSLITENGVAALDSNQDFFSIPSVAMDGYLFAVTKNDGTSNYQPLFGDLIITGLTSGGSKWEMRKKADSSVLILTSESATVQSLLSYDTQANQAEIYVNGVSGGTDTSTNAYPAANTLMFASGVTSYQGTIQEVVVYNSDQNTNRAAIESNINTYYQIYWDGSQTSLLDDYPSASAAYSVRALNSAYTEPLLRVRRSSDNAEQDIRALYDGNLDEEGLLNFVGANDGFVVTWYDQSGNGLDATQATASKQPQIVSSGTIEKIGLKPVLKAVSGNTLLSTSLSGSTDTWSFSVNQFSSIASGGNVLALSSGVGSYLISSNGSSSPSIVGATYKSVRDNTVELLTTRRDDIYEAILTRSLLTTNVNDSSFTNKQFGHPSATAFSMPDLQEYIEYHTDQSANRADIESKINTYYDFYWDGTVSDPDAQAYLDEVVAQGGSLTNEVADEYNAFVLREKAASRYSKIKRLYPFLGGVIDSARVDAVTLAQATNNNFVDADADATCGLQGDGSTKSLRLTETADNILPDSTDFQIGVFRIGAVEQSTSLSRLFGYLNISNTANRLYLQKNQLQPQCFATDGVAAAGGVLSSNSSHIGASFSSTDLKVLLDGVVTLTSTTARSTSFGTESIDLFAFNVNGSPLGHSSINSGGYFIASGLTLAETQAFESSYKTFLTNIGAI